MIKPEVLDAMLASGCTAEQIVAVVKAAVASHEETTSHRRAKDAERKRRQRHAESRDVTRTNADISDPPSPPCPPDKEIPPKPPKEINPLISPQPLSRASRISDDFEPDLVWAEDQGLSHSQAKLEADKFRDYWRAKGGKDAAKKDWPATWRNWVRSAVERLPRGSPKNPQKQTMSSVLTNLITEMETSNDVRSSQSSLGFEPAVLNLPAPSRQRDP